jgi:hypothetical protein
VGEFVVFDGAADGRAITAACSSSVRSIAGMAERQVEAMALKAAAELKRRSHSLLVARQGVQDRPP